MSEETEGATRTPGGDAESWIPMLRVRPVRNTASRVEDLGDGTLRIYVPRRRPWWYAPPISWIFVMRPERGIGLDRLGAEVFRWCDGERTVEDIIDLFAERHALTFHEARAAVTQHLRELVRRGGLAGTVPRETGVDEATGREENDARDAPG